jgi:RNA polymerase sigma-70 factor (ECF subfamily)
MDTAGRKSDEWLALRCQTGEVGAFEDLLAVMERPLLYYAAKLVRSEERALDVLQEVWLRVFRDIRRLKEPGSLRPWLYTLTHGIAVDRIRGSVSRARAEEAHSSESGETAEPDFSWADADAVHEALDQLELKHREVLVLHFLEEFSVEEIALVVGCPPGTVKSRIYHAKREMKGILVRGGYGK